MISLVLGLAYSLQQQRLPSSTELGGFQNIVGEIYKSSPCWIATCKDPSVQVYPQAKLLIFLPSKDGKTRGELDGEQPWGTAVVGEDLIRAGRTYHFIYQDSVVVQQSAGLPFWGLAPLVSGENYLVWSSPFNGKNSDGTFSDAGLIQQIVYQLPSTISASNSRLARARLRTAANTVPANDADLLKLAAQSLRFGGADARDAAHFLSSIDSVTPKYNDFVRTEFPRYMMEQRNSYTDKPTRAFCSYLAFYLGGSSYLKDWMDDMVGISFADSKQVNSSVLMWLKHDCFKGRSVPFGTLNGYQNTKIVESDEVALNRFKRAKDANVRHTLVHYLNAPTKDTATMEWIKIFVKTQDEEWAKDLASKLASWVKNPALSPKSGQTLDSVRDRYRQIYSIE